jgi:hypothetical protein
MDWIHTVGSLSDGQLLSSSTYLMDVSSLSYHPRREQFQGIEAKEICILFLGTLLSENAVCLLGCERVYLNC